MLLRPSFSQAMSSNPSTSTLAEVYENLKVDSRNFRVLELQPSNDKTAPIVCTLKSVRLDAETGEPSQPYEALSYVWGLREAAELIKCNNISVPVKENCLEALHQLRRPSTTRLLFVDAICINQRDNNEKGEQVAIMGDIYAGAKCVLAWLGANDGGMNLVFQDFRRLFRLRPFLVDGEGVVKDTAIVRYFRDMLYNSHDLSIIGCFIPSQNGWRFKMWFDVIDRIYFERVWPLQETAFSRHTVLICGRFAVDLAAARFAIQFMKPYWTEMTSLKYLSPRRIIEVELDDQGNLITPQKKPELETAFGLRHSGYEAHEILGFIVGLGSARDIWKDQSKWKYIDHVLRINADLKASNPLDKVYSLYSVLNRICEDFPKPKYDRSTELLWLLANLSIIKSFRSLDLIANTYNDGGCPIHRSTLYCMSSSCEGSSTTRWSYRWESEPTKAHWQRPFSFFDQRLPRGTAWDREPRVIHQGQSMSIKVALANFDRVAKYNDVIRLFYIDDVRLSVQGKLLTRISKVSSQPAFLSSWISAQSGKEGWHYDDTFLREMTVSFREWLDLIRTAYTNMQEAHRVLYRLLMWERSPEVTSTSLEDFARWCSLIESLSDRADSISDVDMETLRDINTRQYHIQLCGFEKFRRLFLTTDGRVGKANYGVRDGDLVVLFCWSWMPAIVRPVNKRDKVLGDRKLESDNVYLLVGFACIDGLMECSEWELQGNELENFCLI